MKVEFREHKSYGTGYYILDKYGIPIIFLGLCGEQGLLQWKLNDLRKRGLEAE